MESASPPPPRASAEIEGKWREIQLRLKEALGPRVFNNWLGSIRVISYSHGRMTLSAPSIIRRDYVVSNYLERIKLLWKQAEPSVRSVEIVVEPDKPGGALSLTRSPPPPMPRASSSAGHTEATQKASTGPSIRASDRYGTNVLSNTGPNPRNTFENFVQGPSNELAFAAARRVAAEPGNHYSALYLHAQSGFGKTHLLHAIGNEVMRVHPDKRVAYVHSSSFINFYGLSNRENDPQAFRELIRSVDILMLDDLQFLSGKDKTYVEFGHTFNALQEAGRQIVMAADKPPGELEGIEAHVRSRLCGALVVNIQQPDFTLRHAILKRKVSDLRASGRGIEVADKVLEFIALKIESNRELDGALLRIANNSEVQRAGTSLEMAEELVRDLIKTPERRISIEDIQRHVAAYYRVSMRDLLSHRRDRVIVRPRQVAMYLSKELTTRSLPEIGRRFGNRDHTTVLYGVRRIAEMRKQNAALSDEIDLLKRIIEN